VEGRDFVACVGFLGPSLQRVGAHAWQPVAGASVPCVFDPHAALILDDALCVVKLQGASRSFKMPIAMVLEVHVCPAC